MAVVTEQIIVGNVGRVYDKRTVGKDNRSVIDFSIAATKRKLNPTTNEWEDEPTYWVTATAWGKLADNIESSFKPGDHVFVKGYIEMAKGYTDKEGVEHEARPKLIANIAGLEVSSFPASSNREKRAGGNSAPAAKSTPAKKAPAAKPAKVDDDSDFDFADLDI